MATLKEQAQEIKAGLEALVAKAVRENRDLTEAEARWVREQAKKGLDLKAQIEKVERSQELLHSLTSTRGDGIDGPADSRDYTGKGLSTGSSWSKAVYGQMRKTADHLGVKALLTGQIAVPPQVEIVELPSYPHRLLDLVARTPLDSHTFGYLRQTARDENVGVTADGTLKPTSTYTFEEVEDRARVVAHLSEPFPLRYLDDYDNLAGVLDSQMVDAVLDVLEAQIVNGTGEGEFFTGILNTTGVTDVPFTTDVLTTIRHARTVLGNKAENPTAWVFNPTDLEALDLMREDGTTGGFLMNSTAADTVFGPGLRRVPSLAVPAGTAILADWSQVRLRVREDAQTLAFFQSGELFKYNLVQLRTEGRYGIEIRRPQAFAVVHLTA
jgi:HK97 family phage major capsid protein